MLAKLFYPVVNPESILNFVKVTILGLQIKNEWKSCKTFGFPFINAFEKTIGNSEYLDFMKSLNIH